MLILLGNPNSSPRIDCRSYVKEDCRIELRFTGSSAETCFSRFQSSSREIDCKVSIQKYKERHIRLILSAA